MHRYSLAILIAFAPACLARDADIVGSWKIELVVKENGQTYRPTVKFVQKDGKIGGVFISAFDGKETPLEGVKISGSDVAFKVSREISGTPVVVAYKGKITGDKIEGTAELDRGGETGTGDFTAKRVKDDGKGTSKEGLSGKYNLSLTGDDGQSFSTVLKLEEKDGKLTGSYTSILDGEEVPFKKIERKGESLEMEIQRERDGQKLFVKFHGKIAGKGKLTGTVDYDAGVQAGAGKFEATRE